jgi:cell division protein FtsI/penicillin-binding protein 2
MITGRRIFLAELFGAANMRAVSLSQIDVGNGSALLLSARDSHIRWVKGEAQARRWVVPPGSTMKPLSLLVLIERGRLREIDEYVCPRHLVLNGINMNCSHPRSPLPMDAARAIAYSCNCATAHFAERFRPGELAQFLRDIGMQSATGLLQGAEAWGHIEPGLQGQRLQLQALGEQGIRVTMLELAMAYRRMAAMVQQSRFAAILGGLEGAVAFGTGRAAQVPGRSVAGKTGTVQTERGERIAWFAGFAPSRAPDVVVTVLVPGRSGAEAAAPIAGQILKAHFAGAV